MPRRFGDHVNFMVLARKLKSLLRYFPAGFLSFCKFVGPLTLVTRVAHIVDGGKITGEGQMRVPPLFADTDNSDWMVEGPISALTWAIGVILGAIHLTAWNFLFLSHIEKIIWRVASTIVTVVALNGFIGITTYMIKTHYMIQDKTFFSNFCAFIILLVFSQFPLYFLARLALLVEALISLRDLSPGALAVVEWTSFIPHV